MWCGACSPCSSPIIPATRVEASAARQAEGGHANDMKRLLTCALISTVVVLATSCGALGGGGGGLKVGMVTDIGQLEDKSFNEFSWKGVQDGAKAIGGTAQAIVTKDIADYKQNIQSFVDQKYDVIVTVGFLIGTDTLAAAQKNPTIQFFGVDQFICV